MSSLLQQAMLKAKKGKQGAAPASPAPVAAAKAAVRVIPPPARVAAPITPPRAKSLPPTQQYSEEEEDENDGEGSEEEEDQVPTPVVNRFQNNPPVSSSSASLVQREEIVMPKQAAQRSSSSTRREPSPTPSSASSTQEEEYIVRRVVRTRPAQRARSRSPLLTPSSSSSKAATPGSLPKRVRSPAGSQLPPATIASEDHQWKRRLVVGFIVFLLSFLALDYLTNKQIEMPNSVQLQLGQTTTFEDLAESTLDKESLRGFELELKSSMKEEFKPDLPIAKLYTAYEETRKTNTKVLLAAGLFAGFVIAAIFT